MPLINFTKEELQKIEYYLLGETDPIVMDILEKIENLDNLCECGGQSNWYIITYSKEVIMSDDEIKTFITTFKSYMERASVSELNYLRRESNRKYREMYYQSQAKKHNVSLDYYISEFT